MQLLSNKQHIRLVYSADEARKQTHNIMSTVDEVWGQLNLFSTEKPDTVIFAQPEDLGFEGIVNILLTGHARRIFDFREMPFISFGNETRESFLRLLSSNKVEYYNKFNLKNKLGKNEDLDLILEIESVKSFLKPLIENGPTVIFSDKSPNKDKFVSLFLKSLSDAKIAHSTVLAEGSI